MRGRATLLLAAGRKFAAAHRPAGDTAPISEKMT